MISHHSREALVTEAADLHRRLVERVRSILKGVDFLTIPESYFSRRDFGPGDFMPRIFIWRPDSVDAEGVRARIYSWQNKLLGGAQLVEGKDDVRLRIDDLPIETLFAILRASEEKA